MQQKIEITKTNQELVGLLQGLFNVGGLKGVKFALVVAKNVKVLKSELEDIEMAAQPTPEFIELSQKVAEFEKKKDLDGIKKLEEKNKKLVDARKKQLAELDKLMKETAKVTLFTFSEDILPAEINGKQLEGIETLIK